ncbi:zinc ribbon domain-containing protein [Halorussus litoreus]|uniref:zinc ribbon domain-containing protein n=1 Tax=Halorussus litoreus TaxID=1710536 RepID=UPI000E277E92|nr:zinc ribbon domain-containing protein [Halorussus litoreus]
MGSVPNFCSQCGASLSPGDAFCSQCGTSVGQRGESDRKSSGVEQRGESEPSSQSAFRRKVRDLTVEGWEVEHDYGDRVVLADRGFGSVPAHLILFVFTLGFVNLLYAVYSYTMGAERVELRAEGTVRWLSGRDGRTDDWRDSTEAGRDGGTDDGRTGRADHADEPVETPGSIAGAAFLALIGFTVLGSATDIPGVFLAGVFLLLSLYSFPPFRARFRERKSVTTFGWVRSTDEWVVDAPDTPCNVCSRPIGTGVGRTFHETFYVAGLPITRDEKGTNGYCRSCAQGDPFTESSVGASDVDANDGEAQVEY